MAHTSLVVYRQCFGLIMVCLTHWASIHWQFIGIKGSTPKLLITYRFARYISTWLYIICETTSTRPHIASGRGSFASTFNKISIDSQSVLYYCFTATNEGNRPLPQIVTRLRHKIGALKLILVFRFYAELSVSTSRLLRVYDANFLKKLHR